MHLTGFPARAVPLVFALALRLVALEAPKTSDAVRDSANWLCQQGRFEEAHEVCGAWLQAHPDDHQVLFGDAYALMLKATLEPDETAGTKLRKQAYEEAMRAKKLGCPDVLADLVLSATSADGRDLRDPNTFSAVPAAVEQMKKGEEAFTRHDLDAALTHYQRALELDPKSYSAALYIGDVYFNRSKFADAIAWFGKAIEIDPDRETAHRYRADAYLKAGKREQARAEYIEAVIAAPYQRAPREMLSRYAGAVRIRFSPPAVAPIRASVTLGRSGPEVKYDSEAGAMVLAYAMARAHWLTEERGKYFPKNMAVRHSLYEECAGLRMLVSVERDIKEDDCEATKNLRPSIRILRDIDAAGLLEAYVLLDRPDKEIVQDYANYRRQHRDLLARYINEFWLGSTGSVTSPNPPQQR